jgi:hypothetical protein
LLKMRKPLMLMAGQSDESENYVYAIALSINP